MNISAISPKVRYLDHL
jgi:hypothetical protein